MCFWAAVMVGLAVSVDGFMVGLAYGIKKIKVPLVSMLIITLASVTAVSLSMCFGKALTMFLPVKTASWLGSALLIILGLYFILGSLREKIDSIEVDGQEPLLTFKIEFLGVMVQILKEPARADFDESGEIGKREALVLGLALSMDALGLGYAELREINPGLIYCSLTGYGQSGPLKDRAGHDINYLALSGLMSYSGRKDTGPALLGTQLADIGSGTNNTIIGILAAVIHRMQTGEGQHIDISMTDGLFPFHAAAAIKELCGENPSTYESEVLGGGSLYGYYETADGRYVSFGGLEHQFFTVFCTAIGLEDLIAGSVLQPGRVEEARRQVAEVIRTKPLAHWVGLFKDKDACVEPVLTFAEAVRSEHAAARGLLVKVPGLNGASHEQLACPIKFSGYAPVYKRIGCRIGQDTKEVLTELGLPANEIDGLKARGVFGEIDIS